MMHPDDILANELSPKVPGVSAAAAKDGKIVWSYHSGFADLTAKVPTTRETRFRIGSVSKPLTSAALALLVERGKLDIDAPVQKYIPDFPDQGAVITLRMLAGHLSGIRNYRGTEALSNPPVRNLRDGLKVFEHDPLETMPGAKFSYSSYNWNILGAVIEAASNQDFLSFLDENLIRPLGLDHTLPDRGKPSLPHQAHFYEISPSGQFVPGPQRDFSSLWPSGGYLSSPEDLVHFGSILMQPGFLSAQSLALLFTSQKTTSGEPTNYGAGWMTVGSFRLHGGDTSGGTAVLLTHPPSRTVVAFTANCGHALLRNAIAKGRAPSEASRFLFEKVPIAIKIARCFAAG